MKNYIKLFVHYDIKLCFLYFDNKLICIMSFHYSKLIFKNYDKELFYVNGSIGGYYLNRL